MTWKDLKDALAKLPADRINETVILHDYDEDQSSTISNFGVVDIANNAMVCILSERLKSPQKLDS